MLANKVHRVTVHRWIRRFNQNGSANARKSFGRRRTRTTKRVIKLIERRVSGLKVQEKIGQPWQRIVHRFFLFLESKS